MIKLILAIALGTLTLTTGAFACDPVPVKPAPVTYILISEVYGRSFTVYPLTKVQCIFVRKGVIANFQSHPALSPTNPVNLERQIFCQPTSQDDD